MANRDQYINAASTPVAQRTQEQRDLVTRGLNAGMQDVKNADYQANKK